MLFQTLTKDAFRDLVERIMLTNEVIAPKRVATNKDGAPIHQYLPVEEFDEIELHYEKTEYSAKTYFLPYKEALSTYRYEGDDWSQEVQYRLQPRVLLGLHSCDINGLVKLDKFLTKGLFPSPYFKSRRKNTVVVGVSCAEPCGDGFCRAVGANEVTHGFDLFLTDLGDRYFVAIGSDRGYSLLRDVDSAAVTEDDKNDYGRARKRFSGKPQTDIQMQNLTTLLDIEFESDVWKRWGARCLSCGNCAMVCPTCYCYGVREDMAMDFSSSTKVKQLYACNFLDFAEVAGGHNFRPDQGSRLKYHYYHQHRGFLEGYEEPKCVGCNRCGRVCPVGIHPVGVIRDLQDEEAS